MDALKVIQIDPALNTTLLDVVWIIIGLVTIYAGIKNLMDKENPSRIGTAIFWCSFGIVCAFGTWLQQMHRQKNICINSTRKSV